MLCFTKKEMFWAVMLRKLNNRQSKLLQTKAQDSSHESWAVLIFTKRGEITYNMYFKGSLKKNPHIDKYKVHSSCTDAVWTVGNSYLYLLTSTDLIWFYVTNV